MERIFLNEHLRKRFGERVQRIPLDAGLVCPNRKASSGCIFCGENGSAASWIYKGMSIKDQFEKGAKIAVRRYRSKKFIAYFQAFTSTAGDIETLDRLYSQVLSYPGVVGMAVSTRPDCLGPDVLDLLAEYNKKTYLWVELGCQSMNDKSLEWMNRGHKVSDFIEAVSKLTALSIESVGHIIFGIPIETKEETLSSFSRFLATGVNGYKVHALHIIKGTELERLYNKEKFELLSMDEYIGLVKEAVMMTPRDVVIHRITAETDPDRLIAPMWVTRKNEILRRVLGELGL